MTTRNRNFEPYHVTRQRDEEERISKLSKEKTLTVRAYSNADDFLEKEYDEDNFEVLCKISEWEWEVYKMSLPVLADNYLYYELYNIVNPSGSIFKVIQG